jgi:hypothetical protein
VPAPSRAPRRLHQGIGEGDGRREPVEAVVGGEGSSQAIGGF